jgi:predicted DNA binding protein
MIMECMSDVDIVFDEEVFDSDDIEDVPENTNQHTRRNDLTLRQRKYMKHCFTTVTMGN